MSYLVELVIKFPIDWHSNLEISRNVMGIESLGS